MSKKVLIADSGSSKTNWCLLDTSGILQRVNSIGLNPDFHSRESIFSEVEEMKSQLEDQTPTMIYFYGSGVSSNARKRNIVDAFKFHFQKASINVEHDLLGAARAAHANNEGLVGILGTGSNCCGYDGKRITEEYRSGGYIIGDEGGGVYLGKLLLKSYIEERLDSSLRMEFEKKYGLDTDQILHNIYKEAFPNRFIASFSHFALQWKSHPQIKAMIEENFNRYFEINVSRFHNYQKLKLGLIGSIANVFQEEIKVSADKYGVQLGNIVKNPIEALAEYHQLRLKEEK